MSDASVSSFGTAVLAVPRVVAVSDTQIYTTTHYGVPVVTYRVTGERATAADVPPPRDGTLQLRAEDGIVYAFDVTLDGAERDYRYTYDVRPAPFPAHGWVETARAVASANASERGN